MNRKLYDEEQFTGTTYLTDQERKQLKFPHENYEEDVRELLRQLRNSPSLCEFFEIDPDEIEACLVVGEQLQPLENDAYDQWRLLRDKRLRAESYAWSKVLEFRKNISGLAETKPEVRQQFRVLFDRFEERAAKAARTRKNNQAIQDDKNSSSE